eukprot:6207037-Pleurochrysis_carterae.AAC.1
MPKPAYYIIVFPLNLHFSPAARKAPAESAHDRISKLECMQRVLGRRGLYLGDVDLNSFQKARCILSYSVYVYDLILRA